MSSPCARTPVSVRRRQAVIDATSRKIDRIHVEGGDDVFGERGELAHLTG
ncbi:MAG: hypothetical protein RI957_894 [Verrucomicrobiota bacterium]|jgi:hypothetical protein